MKTFRTLLTEVTQRKPIVVSFGRMNPITVGHAKLVKAVKDQATALHADHMIVLSQSYDPKKNPLTWAQKVSYFKKFFPGVNISSNQPINNMAKLFTWLEQNRYKDVILVVGQDRVDEFKARGLGVSKTGEKLYGFESFRIVSAGARNANASGVEGMSASKLREFVAAGDFKNFSKGVPSSDGVLILKYYNDVRKGMNLK